MRGYRRGPESEPGLLFFAIERSPKSGVRFTVHTTRDSMHQATPSAILHRTALQPNERDSIVWYYLEGSVCVLHPEGRCSNHALPANQESFQRGRSSVG
jgi:hypothetical protein